MKKLAMAAVALALGGCLSDADTANNRSVLPGPTGATKQQRVREDDDKPRQLCESTVEGNDTKMICY